MPVESRERQWSPVLPPDEVSRALAVARAVAERLRDPDHVSSAGLTSQHSPHARPAGWQALGVSRGFAGLSLLWGIADQCMPHEAWDLIGHQHLQRAVRAAERHPDLDFSMFSGLGGLAFASWYLSRRGTRYRKALCSIDSALLSSVSTAVLSLSQQNHHGIPVSTFDVISGLAGVGRYLLLRSDEASHRAALEGILHFLASLATTEEDIPRWHTPAQFISETRIRDIYPFGNLNCGLAHGIPGPLTLLSLAMVRGVVVEQQHHAVRCMADWLCRHSIHDQWGLNWPAAVPVGAARSNEPTKPLAGLRPSRTAWCYGSPGVARSLWLAGAALAEPDYQKTAITAMEAVYRRPISARHIDSPTFCHGIAGLQQITLRFANDTGLPLFAEAAQALHSQLISVYEPESRWGYRDLEPNGTPTDRPGLLDGAAGVALVLFAASTPVEPAWDSLFLLS